MVDQLLLAIEVVWATPDRQTIRKLEVQPGTTAREAARMSGLEPLIDAAAGDIESLPLGVFGHKVADNYQLKTGDRVELYRPLRRDPREARRLRARSRQD